MKYSIVIPTYNNLDDLRECCESIVRHTDLGTVEVLVVSNGCRDGTREYVLGLGEPFRLLEYPMPLGYPAATNIGIMAASRESQYVVLLNNDCVILAPGWLEMLERPFREDHRVGISGPSRLWSEQLGGDSFLIFFLVCIRKDLFQSIGYLDTSFYPGAGEDIDFCGRARRAGYKLAQVPFEKSSWSYDTEFPIFHKAEQTVHKLPGWEEGFWKRMSVVKDRFARGAYTGFADVTCEISTKGRYDTTLPWAMASVAMQTVKPKTLLVFEDDVPPVDFRDRPIFDHVLRMLDAEGIEWHVIFGEGRGQVLNHQKALSMSRTKWVWRLDDDNFAEKDVLEKLLAIADEGVGAVGGAVVTPTWGVRRTDVSSSLADIYTMANRQWSKFDPAEGPVEVDHLYSSFLYLREAGLKNGYHPGLSRVGHREETIFSHNIKRAGFKLLVRNDAVTWHFRDPSGGIRMDSHADMWQADESVFSGLMREWGVGKDVMWVNLDCGMGDHVIFLSVLDEIKAANPGKELWIAACYPHLFDEADGVVLKSVAEGRTALGKMFDDLNVYLFCAKTGWENKPLAEAFKNLYIK